MFTTQCCSNRLREKKESDTPSTAENIHKKEQSDLDALRVIMLLCALVGFSCTSLIDFFKETKPIKPENITPQDNTNNIFNVLLIRLIYLIHFSE